MDSALVSTWAKIFVLLSFVQVLDTQEALQVVICVLTVVGVFAVLVFDPM